MSAFLLKLLELSLQAGALTLGILLVRLVFRKLPAKYFCLLWAIVAVRLVVPFSFETGFAWAPNLQTLWSGDVGRILRTFKIKKNVEVTDNGKDNF